MTKKKKTQLKPVARGFAVTSIPKKAPPESPPLTQHDSDVNDESASSDVPHATQTHEPVKDEALNAEERSLQDLVDKLQERVEKEIVRTVKVRTGGDVDIVVAEDWLIRRLPLFRLSKRRGDSPIPFRCWTWMRMSSVRSCPWRAILRMTRV
jgi:hypothetical protein